jgi:hypothetical protein
MAIGEAPEPRAQPDVIEIRFQRKVVLPISEKRFSLAHSFRPKNWPWLAGNVKWHFLPNHYNIARLHDKANSNCKSPQTG